jgi:colanic acid/amylovoran biosynthesis glycosyltransferase
MMEFMSDPRILKVGQLVDCYLRTTENWCFRLMRHIPDVKLQIITTTVMNEGMFPLQGAEFVVAPLARLSGRELRWPIGHIVKKLQLPLLALWRLAVIRRARPLALAHAHFSVMGWNYLWLVNHLSLPLVVSFYGFDYEWLPRNEPRWQERYRVLFEKAQMFITEGEFGRSKLVSMGCPEGKVKVLHLGVEPSLIPVFQRRKEPGRLRLIQVATFTAKKGHDTTIQAFARALKCCPGMKLTLVGKDPEQKRHLIERLIGSLGLEEHVTIVDGVDFTGLHRIFAEFEVFIHPSRHSDSGDSEGGAPVVLLDAQATGLPVIATTHCDIPDEVIDGETGLLAEEGDVEGIAQHIEYFYGMDDHEYQEFCLRARRHVEEHYDAAKNAVLLRQIYQEVVEKRRVRWS